MQFITSRHFPNSLGQNFNVNTLNGQKTYKAAGGRAWLHIDITKSGNTEPMGPCWITLGWNFARFTICDSMHSTLYSNMVFWWCIITFSLQVHLLAISKVSPYLVKHLCQESLVLSFQFLKRQRSDPPHDHSPSRPCQCSLSEDVSLYHGPSHLLWLSPSVLLWLKK